MSDNLGFDPSEIARFSKELEADGRSFQYIDEAEISSDLAEFLFVGKYEGKPVIFDCLLGTLQMAYESNLMELAEEKARKKFPDYKGFDFDVDGEGNAVSYAEESEEVEEYKAYAMFELEEAGEGKVAESLTYDLRFEYGVGLEVYLNVSEINESVIQKFIRDFNNGALVLDPTQYAFEAEDDEDE